MRFWPDRILFAANVLLDRSSHLLSDLSWPWLFALGIGLGSGLGASALLGVGGWLGQGLCMLMIGLALRLGWNAQPVLVGAPVPPLVKKTKPALAKKKLELDWLPRKHRLANDISGLIRMVELPGGTFQMGSPITDDLAFADEGPQHSVTVSAFAISCYPVTRKLYRKIIDESPKQWEGNRDDDWLPANYVSWLDAVKFCNLFVTIQPPIQCLASKGGR